MARSWPAALTEPSLARAADDGVVRRVRHDGPLRGCWRETSWLGWSRRRLLPESSPLCGPGQGCLALPRESESAEVSKRRSILRANQSLQILPEASERRYFGLQRVRTRPAGPNGEGGAVLL